MSDTDKGALHLSPGDILEVLVGALLTWTGEYL
jgi:hypothetical protein